MERTTGRTTICLLAVAGLLWVACSSDGAGQQDARGREAGASDATSTKSDGVTQSDGVMTKQDGSKPAQTGEACAKAGGRCDCSCGDAFPIDSPPHNDCPQPCDTCGACSLFCCLPDPDCNATAGCVKVCQAGDCQCECPPSKTSCAEAECDRMTEVCVGKGPVGPSVDYSCQPVPTNCAVDRDCSCMAGSLCNQGDSCVDESDNKIFCDNGSQ